VGVIRQNDKKKTPEKQKKIFRHGYYLPADNAKHEKVVNIA